jgi:hypothetical protein
MVAAVNSLIAAPFYLSDGARPVAKHVLLVAASGERVRPLQEKLIEDGFAVEVAPPDQAVGRLTGPRWVIIDTEQNPQAAGILHEAASSQPRLQLALLGRSTSFDAADGLTVLPDDDLRVLAWLRSDADSPSPNIDALPTEPVRIAAEPVRPFATLFSLPTWFLRHWLVSER